MSQANHAPAVFNSTVDIIRSEHITAARAAIRDSEILRELELEIDRDCDGLRSFLFATQVRHNEHSLTASANVKCRSSMRSRQDRGTILLVLENGWRVRS